MRWLPLLAAVALLGCRPDDSLGDSQHPWALWGTDGYGQKHWLHDYYGPRAKQECEAGKKDWETTAKSLWCQHARKPKDWD